MVFLISAELALLLCLLETSKIEDTLTQRAVTIPLKRVSI
jgi:hypothetical protein